MDVGYLIGPFDHEDFETVSLGADPLCLVAARGHPLLARERLAPADLEGEPMVLGDLASWEAYRQRLDDLFAAEGTRLAVALEAPSTLALVGLVANGLGVTVYPASLAGLLGGEVAARPFDGAGLEVETVLARKRVNRTAAVRAFLRLARAVA